MTTPRDQELKQAHQALVTGDLHGGVRRLLALLARWPNTANAYALLGTAWHQQHHLAQRTWAYRQATAHGASQTWALCAAASVAPVQPSVEVADQEWERVARELADLNDQTRGPDTWPLPAGPLTSFFFWAYLGRDTRPLMTQHAALVLRLWPDLAWTAPHCRDDAPPRRAGPPRAGVLWDYPPGHPIDQCTAYLFDALTRAGAETTAYCAPGLPPLADYGLPATVRQIPLTGGLHARRERIAEDALDVLVYPEVGMNKMALQLACARLAHRQWSTIGHPLTSGLPTIDAFLSSRWVESDDADDDYSETLVRLDGTPLPYPQSAPPPVHEHERRDLRLPDGNLYALPHNTTKLHPRFDPLLRQILERDPDAVLVIWDRRPHFTAALAARLRRTLAPFADRVRWHPRFEGDDFLRFLRQVDVVLDPITFCTGTTLRNTLVTGTPIITWPQRFYRTRLPAGMYRFLGVTDSVAASADDYVKKAVHYATDKAANRALRARIVHAAQTRSPDDALTQSAAEYAQTTFQELTP